MKKIAIVAFILSTGFIFNSQIAIAQDNNSTNTGSVVINWSVIENTPLAPLENIQLPPPQLADGSRGERQTFLQIGEPAPWPGVILNPAAVAFILSETEASYSRARLALVRQRESDTSRLHLEVSRLRLQNETDRAQAEIIVGGLNRTILRIQTLHKNYIENLTGGFWRSRFGTFLKWGLVVIGAGAVGVIVGYVAAP